MPKRYLPRFIAVLLLLILIWLQFSTLPLTSPTMDEGLHLTRGYAFVARGDERLRLRGPILPNALSGAVLRLLEPDLELAPDDDPAWLDTEGADLSEQFVWANRAPPLRIVFLGRLPILFFGLILGAFIFRWASERSGPWAALGALTLYVFCPNLLAHARLATTDTITAATFLISAYAFSRALDRPSWTSYLCSGGALSLALAAKFSATALLAAFAVGTFLYSVHDWRDRLRWRALIAFGVTLTTAALMVWAIYRFTIGPVVPGGFPMPAPLHWAEWNALQAYVAGDKITPGYLFGEMEPRGWFYYYPLTFLLKTPLPVLILLVLGVLRTMSTRAWRRDSLIWLPPLFLLVSLLFSPHDIGYRYLLPILPFVFVGSAEVMVALWRKRWARVLIGILIAWQIIGTLHIYPYYLTFFNEIAGGPDRGRYILSDSNIDWGQDLVGVKSYVAQHKIDHLKLSYFGIAHPTTYGLRTEALPPVRTALRDQSAWWLHTYYPADPPPGKYAISVANLMGGIWIDRAAYAFFRDRPPDTTIGNSIYVYTIEPRGPAADLSLAGLQIDQIDPATYQHFNTNDVRPRWFDATSSLIVAPGETWIGIADNQPIAPEFLPLFRGIEPITRAPLTDENRSYALYHVDLAQGLTAAAQQATPLSVKFGDTAELLGYDAQQTDRELKLITYWRVGQQIETPLQMFVHVLGRDGSIVAQQDRLDVPAYGWRGGDVIAQIHHINLPPDLESGMVAIGLYNPDANTRLPVTVNGETTDRLLLTQLDLK
jgi:hypothetical protein